MRAPARPTDTTTILKPADAAAAVGAAPRTSSTSSHSVDGFPAPSSRRHLKLSIGLIAAAVTALAFTPADAQAQEVLTKAVVEFTCPLSSGQTVPPADPLPGALVAENSHVFYVTRAGQLRLVRLTPSPTAPVCNWWDLDAATVTTGGLRIKSSANLSFIRGVTDIQRINTVTNARTRWVDGLTSLSDVAISTNGANNVFTTGVPGCLTAPGLCDPTAAVVQRFSVVNGSPSASITRWLVGGGAGTIPYSGIDVHPATTNLVYFSQPANNIIGELNTNDGTIRRWNLAAASTMTTGPIFNPRQLDVDGAGFVWVVTGSGHVVRLEPTATTDNVVVADIPFGVDNNPVAIHSDGTIGYTTNGGAGLEKVGALQPVAQNFSTVTPVSGSATAQPSTSNAPPVTVTQFTGAALRFLKTAPATLLMDLNENGFFTEALIDEAVATNPTDCSQPIDPMLFPDHPCFVPSTLPQGIAHDPNLAGAFYAAIGGSVLRIAHVALLGSPDFTGGGVTTGSGKVALTDPITGLPAGTGSFSLWAYKNSASQPVRGALAYTAPDGKINSLQVTGLTFVGNTATITGLCKSGSNCTTFQLKVTDGGWQASQDVFKIIKDPILGLGLEKGGNLGNGSIKMYRWGQ